jgi:phage pi2 protein 07
MEQLTKYEYCALEILKSMISNPELSKNFIIENKNLHGDFIYDNNAIDCACLMASEFLELCNNEF